MNDKFNTAATLHFITKKLLNDMGVEQYYIDFMESNKLLPYPIDLIENIDCDNTENNVFNWLDEYIINANIKVNENNDLLSYVNKSGSLIICNYYDYEGRLTENITDKLSFGVEESKQITEICYETNTKRIRKYKNQSLLLTEFVRFNGQSEISKLVLNNIIVSVTVKSPTVTYRILKNIIYEIKHGMVDITNKYLVDVQLDKLASATMTLDNVHDLIEDLINDVEPNKYVDKVALSLIDSLIIRDQIINYDITNTFYSIKRSLGIDDTDDTGSFTYTSNGYSITPTYDNHHKIEKIKALTLKSDNIVSIKLKYDNNCNIVKVVRTNKTDTLKEQSTRKFKTKLYNNSQLKKYDGLFFPLINKRYQ